MPDSLKAPLIFALNVLATFAITYLFIVVLMTAAAQQRVGTLLDQQNSRAPADSQTDYSSAWAKVKATDELDRAVTQSKKALDEAITARKRADLAQREERRGFSAAWEQFLADVAAAARASGCSGPAARIDDPGQWALFANQYAACVDLEKLPKPLRQRIGEALQGEQSIGLLSQGWIKANDNAETAADDEKDDQAAFDQAKKDRDEAVKLRTPFNEMTVLRTSWYLGHGAFVDFPPSMMQILLAFFSGIFGALLVTLVLVVYPKSALSTSAGAQNASRILLGGLISLGVYIVLGGGAAVLGSTSPFDHGQANFMMFCAVGVLAGMFSDRVAFWLSDRANAFFSRDPAIAADPDAIAAPTRGDTDPPAPSEHAYG